MFDFLGGSILRNGVGPGLVSARSKFIGVSGCLDVFPGLADSPFRRHIRRETRSET